ncbi:MAG: hypothetical protein K0R23_3886 [Lacrimispora sp.]|jgi:hypothetical protein|nr:hypothetical protein [Lacrimispora sp.]
MNPEFWAALDQLAGNSEIVIDRPKGSIHPIYPDFKYNVDYGYLKNTTSMDGQGIDVWVGTERRKRNYLSYPQRNRIYEGNFNQTGIRIMRGVIMKAVS